MTGALERLTPAVLRPLPVRLALLAALQAAILSYMVADRAMLIARGETVTLAVEPVDPRDLLRGEYVTLDYRIATLRLPPLSAAPVYAVGARAHVTLQPGEDGVWRAVAVSPDRPEAPPGGVVIRGRVDAVWDDLPTPAEAPGPACASPCPAIGLDYGIGQYFVPEGQGPEIEAARDRRLVSVDVAVDGAGRAAIKALSIDGVVYVQEPLF